MTAEEPHDSRMTTDRETIERWAEEHGVTPVEMTARETTVESSSPYGLHTETERTETMETLAWDEFFRRVENDDLVVVYHRDDADQPFEVLEHDQAVSRASLEANELQERLLAGDTVTSELTETTVIERTIVEHATIESEIVDTEILDSRVVDARLVSREIGGCDVVNREALDESDHSRFGDMSRLESGYREDLPSQVTVEVEVEEDWSVTRELLERATVESRIVDVDVTESDEVEYESLESSIEIESIQQKLLESDIIETEADAQEVIQSGTIESEFHEDDIVRTHINQRRLVEDQVTEWRLLHGELTESEVVQAETKASTPVETAFVDSTDLDTEYTSVGVTEYGTDTTDTGGNHDERVTLTEEDEGKPVVDAQGESIGLVEEVRAGTAYVDPEPGIVDKIKAKLGWGDADEDDYPIDKENIGRITDDEVELRVRE